MTDFLNGATAMGCVVSALFFFRFYRQSADRLFLFFGLGFSIFAANRLVLALLDEGHEASTYVYLSRLLAFVMILFAIIDKNRKGAR
jgi:hypothetical protein